MESLENLPNNCIRLLHENNLLKPLIRSELIRNILSKINIDNEVKEKIIADFISGLNIPNDGNLDQWLKENGLDKTKMEELALSKIRLKAYCKSNFEHQAEARFLERKQALDIAVYSIIRVQDFFLAREIFFRIQDNEATFGDMAAKHSEGIENKTRGIIGPSSLDKAHPKISELVRQSKIGELHSPIQIDKFFIVFRLEYFEAAKLDNFMKEKMSEELLNNWIEKEANTTNQKLIERILSNSNKSNLEKIQ